MNLPEVNFAPETLRINLVDILGARGPRGKPSVTRDHLDPADRLIVARRPGQFCFDGLAGEFLSIELLRIEFGEPIFLFANFAAV